MSNLPAWDTKLNVKKISKETGLPTLDYSVDDSSRFAELRDIDEYLDSSYETVEALMLNDDLVDEYERIKESYSGLINMFQKSIENNKPKETTNTYNFNSIAQFEDAISTGEFNINDYSINEISALMNELSELERKLNNRSLDEYELETIEDFHKAVDSGILDISKYNIQDINDLLHGLKDKNPLSISDYNINLFGDITIEEINIKISERDYNQLKGLKTLPNSDIFDELTDSEIIDKQSEVDQVNLNTRNPIVNDKYNPIDEYIYEELETEEIDKSIISKIVDFIKNKLTKGPPK